MLVITQIIPNSVAVPILGYYSGIRATILAQPVDLRSNQKIRRIGEKNYGEDEITLIHFQIQEERRR